MRTHHPDALAFTMLALSYSYPSSHQFLLLLICFKLQTFVYFLLNTSTCVSLTGVQYLLTLLI